MPTLGWCQGGQWGGIGLAVPLVVSGYSTLAPLLLLLLAFAEETRVRFRPLHAGGLHAARGDLRHGVDRPMEPGDGDIR